MIPVENLHPGMYFTVLGWSKDYERRQGKDEDEDAPPWMRREREHPLTGQPLMVMAVSLPFFTAESAADSTVIILDARDVRLHLVAELYADSCRTGYQRQQQRREEEARKKLLLLRDTMAQKFGGMETVPPEEFKAGAGKTCPHCGSTTYQAMMGDINNPHSMLQGDFCPRCMRPV